MAIIGKTVLFGAILCLSVHEGRFKRPPTVPPTAAPSQCSECSDTTIPGNASDPIIRQNYERILTARVWSSGVPRTPLIAQLGEILLEMSASDSIYFSHVAWMHTVWATFLLTDPNLYISFCPFAKIINDSLTYSKIQDDQIYIKTFYEVSSTVYNACSIMTHTTLQRIGCTNLSAPLEFSRNCYGNGLTFCAQEAWNQYGRLVPHVLTDLFFQLYNSQIYLERANAVILAFILTPAHFKLFIDHSPALNFESIEIFVEIPTTSRCCCDCRQARLLELWEQHNETVYANTTTEVDIINGLNCE